MATKKVKSITINSTKYAIMSGNADYAVYFTADQTVSWASGNDPYTMTAAALKDLAESNTLVNPFYWDYSLPHSDQVFFGAELIVELPMTRMWTDGTTIFIRTCKLGQKFEFTIPVNSDPMVYGNWTVSVTPYPEDAIIVLEPMSDLSAAGTVYFGTDLYGNQLLAAIRSYHGVKIFAAGYIDGAGNNKTSGIMDAKSVEYSESDAKVYIRFESAGVSRLLTLNFVPGNIVSGALS